MATKKATQTDFMKALSSNIPLSDKLNLTPPNEWILTHKTISNYRYLPIERVEYLLKSLFAANRIEVKSIDTMFNAISVSVRVHYLRHGEGEEWQYHDGVGAKALQTKSGTGILKMDMSNMNPAAVEMALPIAKTAAVKDACDHLGRIFGSDLNRKTSIEYNKDDVTIDMLTEIYENNKGSLSDDMCSRIETIIGNNEEQSYKKAFQYILASSI